jgi:hypothetical protein
MSDVMSFKMVSGEEVVAELVSTKTFASDTDPVSYTVRRPHILQFQPVGPGQLGLAFVPWTLSNPAIERLEIPASAVLLTFQPADKVERQYLEQTSGISLAGAGMKV